MADIKFSCPHCAQHITCDELWCGHEIQCPSCQGTLGVPAKPAPTPTPVPASGSGNTLVPKVPQSAAPRLSLGQAASQHPGLGAQPAQRSIPVRNLAPPPPKKKNVFLQIGKVAGLLVVVGGCLYAGYLLINNYESKSTKKQEGSDGGQVGHIANLYNVLDATEPGGAGLGSIGQHHGTGPRERSSGSSPGIAVPGEDGGQMSGAGSEKQLPLVPAVWSGDLATAKIPEGRANGTVSGTNFVVETARLDPVGQAQALRLIQGQPTSPDRELVIYLHPKPGEKIGAQPLTLEVASDAKGVPQVLKRWKTNPKYAPQQKSFYNGYVMKLELAQTTNGIIPGKIILCLPDPEKSVVGGVFHVSSPLFEMDTATAPGVAPTAKPPPPTAGRAALHDRYGIQ